MNVIRGAVDDQCGSAHFADNASEVENYMQKDVGRCMRQSLSPPWGSPFVVADPRLAPWAAFLRRFAASLCRGLHSCAALRLSYAVGCVLAPVRGSPIRFAGFLY